MQILGFECNCKPTTHILNIVRRVLRLPYVKLIEIERTNNVKRSDREGADQSIGGGYVNLFTCHIYDYVANPLQKLNVLLDKEAWCQA